MKTKDNISEYIEGCIPSDLLLKYVKGELSGQEKNRIERHLSSCEMCSDELEGLSIMENPERIEEISNELNQQIDAFTAKPQKETISLGLYFRVAASIILLLGVSTIIYFTAFRRTTLLAPNYAMMEIASPKPVKESDKERMENSVADVDKMEKLDLAKENEPHQKNIGGNRKAIPEESVKYVAPVVVDSVSVMNADEAVAEIKIEAPDSNDQKKSEVTEDMIIVSESLAQPVSVSAENKSKSARGVVEKKDIASGISSSIQLTNSETYNTRKATAINLFSREKYKDAIVILDKLYTEFPERDTIAYYTSLCNFNLKRYSETIDKISFLAISPLSPFYSQAEWYYALALIKVDRKDEATIVLSRIINENSPFKKDAKKELGKLKSK